MNINLFMLINIQFLELSASIVSMLRSQIVSGHKMTHYDFDAFINDGTLKEIKMANDGFYKATITYTVGTDPVARNFTGWIKHQGNDIIARKIGGRNKWHLCSQQAVINEWSEAMIR